MVVIGRAEMRTSHDTVAGFLRGASGVTGRVHVRLSDASGVAIEETSWFNESTDTAVLATEIAEHIAGSARARPDLEAVITVEG